MGPLHTPPSNRRQPPPIRPAHLAPPTSPPQPSAHPRHSFQTDTIFNSSQISIAPSPALTSAEKWDKLTTSIMLFWKQIFAKRCQYSSILKKYTNFGQKYLSVIADREANPSVIETEETIGNLRKVFLKKIDYEIQFLKKEVDILKQLAQQFQQREDLGDSQPSQIGIVGQNEMFRETNLMKREQKKFLIETIEKEASFNIAQTKHIYTFKKGEPFEIGDRSNLAVIVKTNQGEIVGGWGGTKKQNDVEVPSAVIFSLSQSKAYPIRKKEQGYCHFLDSFIIFGKSELQLKNLCSRILSKSGKEGYFFDDDSQTPSNLLQNGRCEGQIDSYDIYEIVFEERNSSLQATIL